MLFRVISWLEQFVVGFFYALRAFAVKGILRGQDGMAVTSRTDASRTTKDSAESFAKSPNGHRFEGTGNSIGLCRIKLQTLQHFRRNAFAQTQHLNSDHIVVRIIVENHARFHFLGLNDSRLI